MLDTPAQILGLCKQAAAIRPMRSRVSLGAPGLAANLQSGKGLGVLSDGDSGNCKQTNVLLQATWQATSKAKFGLNWGESRLKDGVASSDLRSNTNVTAGCTTG